jgi:hypothetical protein
VLGRLLGGELRRQPEQSLRDLLRAAEAASAAAASS